MSVSKDCQKWLDKQADEFMVPVVDFFTADQAKNIMQEADEYDGADREYTDGYYSRLSAPGYLDCTDWLGPFASEDEALEALYETYGDE